MGSLKTNLRRLAEAVAAAIMAAMFLTFILQITIRYTSRLDWLAQNVPFLNSGNFGWTLEFCLVLWVWLVFWGNAFVVRNSDHVTFDILYQGVTPRVRRAFAIITGLAIAIALFISIEPTWGKFHILRLKKTATLSTLFGDMVRMRDIYSIYIFFLIAVSARYLWQVWKALRHGVPEPVHHVEGRLDE
ncbi:MAG: TRAP transporter small permease subunit [Rhizobiaceae bacterium]